MILRRYSSFCAITISPEPIQYPVWFCTVYVLTYPLAIWRSAADTVGWNGVHINVLGLLVHPYNRPSSSHTLLLSAYCMYVLCIHGLEAAPLDTGRLVR